MPGALDELIRELGRLPGVGNKTATRLAFHLLRAPEQQARALARAIEAVRDRVHPCGQCGVPTDVDPCPTCTDPRRDPAVLCVVSQPQDVIALERSGAFRGRYHVLGGVLSPLDGIGPDELRIRPLIARLEGGQVQEVIVATSPTAEGDATALYLTRLIKPLGPKVSRIAAGVPIGGELEYTDGVTLGRALAARRDA